MGDETGNDINLPVSTFETATGDDAPHSRPPLDEFGEDPVLTASRHPDARERGHSSHGLRFAVSSVSNGHSEWACDSSQTPTTPGWEHGSMALHQRDAFEMSPRTLYYDPSQVFVQEP